MHKNLFAYVEKFAFAYALVVPAGGKRRVKPHKDRFRHYTLDLSNAFEMIKSC